MARQVVMRGQWWFWILQPVMRWCRQHDGYHLMGHWPTLRNGDTT